MVFFFFLVGEAATVTESNCWSRYDDRFRRRFAARVLHCYTLVAIGFGDSGVQDREPVPSPIDSLICARKEGEKERKKVYEDKCAVSYMRKYEPDGALALFPRHTNACVCVLYLLNAPVPVTSPNI